MQRLHPTTHETGPPPLTACLCPLTLYSSPPLRACLPPGPLALAWRCICRGGVRDRRVG